MVTPTPMALVVPSPLHFSAKRNGDSRCTRVSHLEYVSFDSEVPTVDLPFLAFGQRKRRRTHQYSLFNKILCLENLK